MRKVNIPKFREEIVGLIESNRDKVTSFEHADDYSIFTFCGKDYACEITLNDKWIGLDLSIDTPPEAMNCGLTNDTDIYPIYGGKNEEIALEIYDDLLRTVKAIFSGNFYYSSDEKRSYTARPKNDKIYYVNYWEKRKLLFWTYASGWTENEYEEADIKKLKLKVLK